MNHPGKFPEMLVTRFVSYFTKTNAWVLDPFAGVASTLISSKTISRNSVGIELNSEFVDIGNLMLNNTKGHGRCHLLQGDSRNIDKILTAEFGENVPQFDYIITSPPYWNMLSKSRGGNDSVHRGRAELGLKQVYSDSKEDIGNIEFYDEYIESVGLVFDKARAFMQDGAYLTVVVQNMRDIDGTLRPIAWDLARRISQSYEIQQEQIWCQDNKPLGCWGYPTTYVANVHHHYCLIFRKTNKHS
jgi:DNA modification methylase